MQAIVSAITRGKESRLGAINTINKDTESPSNTLESTITLSIWMLE